jgi:hypothetical protein
MANWLSFILTCVCVLAALALIGVIGSAPAHAQLRVPLCAASHRLPPDQPVGRHDQPGARSAMTGACRTATPTISAGTGTRPVIWPAVGRATLDRS